MSRTTLAGLGLLLLSHSVVADTLAVCTKAEREAYFDSIERKIHESWRVPYDNRGISCKVLIKQDWRGEVRDVGIALCGEDLVVQRSIINAAYRASPMPMPGNKTCFTESVIVTIEIRTQASA
jgi:hypothetical protein